MQEQPYQDDLERDRPRLCSTPALPPDFFDLTAQTPDASRKRKGAMQQATVEQSLHEPTSLSNPSSSTGRETSGPCQLGPPAVTKPTPAVDRLNSSDQLPGAAISSTEKIALCCESLSIVRTPSPARVHNERQYQRAQPRPYQATDFDTSVERLGRQEGKGSAPGSQFEMKAPPYLQLPEKRYGRVPRNLRWTIFSVYRRLCILVIAANVSATVALGANNDLFKLPDSVPHISTAVSINLVVAVLMRQELVVNALFLVVGNLPQSLPLKLRHLAAKVYHYGGIHSGAGISTFLWFLLYNNAISKLCRSNHVANSYKVAILFFMSIIDGLLILIIVFAEPTLRFKIHNIWEVTHRFAGWMTVAAFWTLFGLLAKVQAQQEKSSVGHVFIHSPTFWCLLITTVSLILPWLRLRKVTAEPIQLSDHAVRLRFHHTQFPAGAAQKISYDGLREFHPFAGIAELDNRPNEFSIIISNAGDWTKKTIQNPPTRLWKRGIPMRGVINVATMFKRVIFIATGSGIGPVLSVLKCRDRFACRIIWSTREPEATYQKEIVEYIRKVDPDAIIFNTSDNGDPDLVHEAYQLYVSHDAEAVFIISNQKVTRKVTYDLECRGVPIFGVIFDS